MNQVNNALSPPQQAWIEKFGFFLERSGYPPSAGRVFALLLVSPEAMLTFDEILDALPLSKGAVSGGIKHLLQMQKITEHKRPGIRRRYFRATVRWQDGVKRFMAYNQALCHMLDEGLGLRGEYADPEFTEALGQSLQFLRFLHEELSGLEARWQEVSGDA